MRLKDAAGTPAGDRLADALRDLFDLEADARAAPGRGTARAAALARWQADHVAALLHAADPASRSSWSSSRRPATAGSTCPSGSSAARACSSRRCRPRCSTAGPTSPCTRPRTCRRPRPTGWSSRPCPSGATPATRWSGRRSPTCPPGARGGHRLAPPPGPARRRSGPTSRFAGPAGQHRHPARPRPAELRRHRRGRRRPRPARAGPTASPRCSTVDVHAAPGRPGRAGRRVPGRRRRRPRRCWPRSSTGRRRRAVDAERAFLAELGGDCDLPAGAYAVGRAGDGAPPSTGLLASLDGHVVRHARRDRRRRRPRPAPGPPPARRRRRARWPRATVARTDRGRRDRPWRLAGRDRLPGRRRARRPRAADRAGRRGAAAGPTSSSTTGCRLASLLDLAPAGRRAHRRGQGARARPASSQDEINALLVERGRTGAHGRAAQGRRPVRVRPRRRGGGRAGRRRRRRSRSCPASPRPSPCPPTPASRSPCGTRRRRSPSSPATRTRRRRRGHRRLGGGRPGRRHDRRADGRGPHRPHRRPRCWPAGRSPDTPAAAVQWGTRPEQRTVRATLATIGRRSDLGTPVDDRHRRGRRRATWPGSSTGRCSAGAVVVTRAREQASRAGRPAARAWAPTPVEVPAIEIADPADGGAALAAAVERLAAAPTTGWCSPRRTASQRLLAFAARAATPGPSAACGSPPSAPAPPTRWPSGHVVADLVPERFVAESLLEAFPDAGPDGGRVLLARAAVARDVLPDGLRGQGLGRSTWSRPTAPCAGPARRRGAGGVGRPPTSSRSRRRRRSTSFLEPPRARRGAAGRGRASARSPRPPPASTA